MTKKNDAVPSFNLWTEPWITLEDTRGELSQHNIRDALANAHEYVAIYDPSPLVVVGIHRLLTAILQDALNPQENADLNQLWARAKFPADKIDKFGKQYADRFDLFSEDKPFLQSADLPMFPKTKEEQKATTTVARLFPETPSGTEVTHYRHGEQTECVISPVAAALGLVLIPPFTSSGGGGGKFMPSINGAPPPIYILPGGHTLFEKLAASLISVTMLSDDYFTTNEDTGWWKRSVPTVVQSSKKKHPGMKFSEHRQLSEVGYLHGLTFPARKVRLHPEKLDAVCSRTGQRSEWCVRRITFQMGESLLKDAPIWEDPFVAYTTTEEGKKTIKSKPQGGKIAWREFTGLFLQNRVPSKNLRPHFLRQFALLNVGKQRQTYPFHCIGLEAKADAKIFGWFDFGFDVPISLLQDEDGAFWTEQALSFATECGKTINTAFYDAFRRKASDGKRAKKFQDERFKRLKERLEADYWATLAGKFRQFVLDLGDRAKQQQTLEDWYDAVVREAQTAFDRAADSTGDDGNTLLKIERGKDECRKWLNISRSKIKQGGG